MVIVVEQRGTLLNVMSHSEAVALLEDRLLKVNHSPSAFNFLKKIKPISENELQQYGGEDNVDLGQLTMRENQYESIITSGCRGQPRKV